MKLLEGDMEDEGFEVEPVLLRFVKPIPGVDEEENEEDGVIGLVGESFCAGDEDELFASTLLILSTGRTLIDDVDPPVDGCR